MNSVIEIVFIAIQLVVVALATLIFVGTAGFALSKPRFLLYPYIGLLFCVTGSSYGRIDAVSPSIYNRGSGFLFFSAVLWFLLAAMLWAKVAATFQRRNVERSDLLPWFAAFGVLLLGHIGVGLFLGVPLSQILDLSGLTNIIWMAVLVMAIQLSFRDEAELIEFTKLIVLVGLLRASYGLVRWAVFGGDPANAYENRHGLDLKLTFFDINDNLVCGLAFCVAAIQLLKPNQLDSTRIWRFVLWATVTICAACIVLSFRRTAWIGFMLASGFVLLQLPMRLRVQAVLLGSPFVLAGIVYSAWKRLSQTRGAGGLESFFFDIQSRQIGPESPRLTELKLALADFYEHPIFGIGSWGKYTGHEIISWQTGETGGSFVHSGVLHIAFKSGLVGLALTIGLAFAFIKFWQTNKHSFEQAGQPIAIAGVAGVLFMIPDLLIGTPIPQIRTMQMLAFCLSLPYVAHAIGTKKSPCKAVLLEENSNKLKSHTAVNKAGGWQ